MQENTLRVSPKKNWKSVLIIAGVVIVIILAAFIIAASQNYFRNGIDFFSLWLAPHLIIEGKNPYSSEDWLIYHKISGVATSADSPFFLYPFPLAVMLIPLGILPIEYAAVIWTALSIVAILISGWLLLSFWKTRWPIAYVIPLLAGIFLFRPVAETLRLGQLDWLILICLVMGLFFWEKQQWFVGGMFMALSVVKPQIGVPVLIFLSIWLLIRRIWKGLIGEAIIGVCLFVLGWLFNHAWFMQWLELGGRKIESTFCCTPTLWGLSSLLCQFEGSCGLKLGTAITVIIFAVLILILIRIPGNAARVAIGLSIPVALLISPYLWTYSQMILLIPILTIVGIMKHRQLPYLLVAPFPLFIALFSLAIVFISMRIGVDVISSTVPIVIFAILLGLYIKYARGNIFEGRSPQNNERV